jgi:hypothetical protein
MDDGRRTTDGRLWTLVGGAYKKAALFIRTALVEAGNGTRTRDILLGKQTLYQLSYTRKILKL